MLVQIYGITTPEDAEMVNASAPDNVGVVVHEGFQTWDGVDEATARLIVTELSDVTVVALSLAVERERILRTVEVVSPSVLHLVRAAEETSALAVAAEHFAFAGHDGFQAYIDPPVDSIRSLVAVLLSNPSWRFWFD